MRLRMTCISSCRSSVVDTLHLVLPREMIAGQNGRQDDQQQQQPVPNLQPPAEGKKWRLHAME